MVGPRTIRSVLAVLVLAGCGDAPGRERAIPLARPTGPFDHSHAWLAEVLVRHVADEGVRYADLDADREALDLYVAQVEAVDAAAFDTWTRNQQLAYLINAYNALALATVVDHYPIQRSLRPSALIRPADSVWQIEGFFDGRLYRVAGRDLTLDQIAHDWIRRRFDEPRAHFALACPARSCPPLRRDPYRAGELEAQLADQTRRFARQRNRFHRAERLAELSAIFDWYSDDFASITPSAAFSGAGGRAGALTLLARHLPSDLAEWLRNGSYRIRFLDFDWRLNEAG